MEWIFGQSYRVNSAWTSYEPLENARESAVTYTVAASERRVVEPGSEMGTPTFNPGPWSPMKGNASWPKSFTTGYPNVARFGGRTTATVEIDEESKDFLGEPAVVRVEVVANTTTAFSPQSGRYVIDLGGLLSGSVALFSTQHERGSYSQIGLMAFSGLLSQVKGLFTVNVDWSYLHYHPVSDADDSIHFLISISVSSVLSSIVFRALSDPPLPQVVLPRREDGVADENYVMLDLP